jgi:hypothetical protein
VDKGLAPLDLLVAMKIALHDGEPASMRRLADELGSSKSSVGNSIRNLVRLGLVKEDEAPHGKSLKRVRVDKRLLRDCLEHSVRWIAPAEIGDFELGLPTAHAAKPLADKLRGDADPLVIPLAHGPMRGRAVTPLHDLAPAAAAKDPKLHRLLALVDALRVGRARDRQLAREELRACL